MRTSTLELAARLALALALGGSALDGAASAQVVNEGSAAQSSAQEMKPLTPEQRRAQEGHASRVPSYDQTPVNNPDSPAPVGGLMEEDRIGAYGSPRWTAHRRFVESRIYVRPEGFFELEYWIIPKVPRHGGPTGTEMQFEAEMGLGHRLQLDLYLVFTNASRTGSFEVDGGKVELRYALADWGVIPGNPTLYGEYHPQKNGPDLAEFKLLLGGEITSRWHWGVNLVWERALTDDLSNTFECNGGLSYAVLDTKFSVGVESKNAFTNVTGNRGRFDEEILLGPSVQWRPVPASHIDIAPLFGLTEKSETVKLFLVAGWEF